MTERFTYWLNDAKLMIEVPVADAVRRAQTKCGCVAWGLTEAMVTGLTPEDRELFASRLSRVPAGDHVVVEMLRASGFTGALVVQDPDITPAAITAAIAAECAAIRGAWAALRAKIEAKPAAAWVAEGYGSTVPCLMHEAVEFLRVPGMTETGTARELEGALTLAKHSYLAAQRANYLTAAVGDLIDTPYGPHPTARQPPTDDDETRVKLALVKAECVRRIDANKAAHAAKIARNEQVAQERAANEAEAKERAEKNDKAIRAFAATIPGLERAAAEGYEVATGVLDTLAERIVAALPSGMTAVSTREGSATFERFKVSASKSPRNKRFAQRDELLRAVGQVTKPERGVTVDVGAVESIRQSGDDDDRAFQRAEEYRGVQVTLTAAGPSARRVVFVRFPD